MLNLVDGFKENLEKGKMFISEDNEYIFVNYQFDKYIQYTRTLTILDKDNIEYHKNFIKHKIYKEIKKSLKNNEVNTVYIYDKQERAKRKVLNSNNYKYYVNNFEKDFFVYTDKTKALEEIIKDFEKEYGDNIEIMYEGSVLEK